jgi:hypothetical protein
MALEMASADILGCLWRNFRFLQVLGSMLRAIEKTNCLAKKNTLNVKTNSHDSIEFFLSGTRVTYKLSNLCH